MLLETYRFDHVRSFLDESVPMAIVPKGDEALMLFVSDSNRVRGRFCNPDIAARSLVASLATVRNLAQAEPTCMPRRPRLTCAGEVDQS